MAVTLWVILGVVFGVMPMKDQSMMPKLAAGDLLLYYRLDRTPGDREVVVFEKEGKTYVGRVVARGGDTVEIREDALLQINGNAIVENEIYYSTEPYEEGIKYPVTLTDEEVFILCDYRQGAKDSRYFGDGDHAIEAVPVQKTVATDGHTYAPDTSFSFRVANGGEGTFEGNVVSAGVTGGLAADENAVFTPSGTTPLASYTSNGSLAVDGSVFTSPGVYHYLVTEVSGDYEGIDYDNSTYDVYLYVYNSDNGLYVGNAVSVKNGNKADLAFTNDYGAREDNDSTHDIIVTKEVTGTMGNKASQEFQFAVSVDGGEGEWYQVLVKETADAAAVEYHVVSGAQATSYSIKHGGSIQVLGLSESDQYSIIEDDYSSLGYTTTNKSNVGTVTADGTTITVTNHKDAASPTGVVTTVVPYVLMLGMAGSLGALFLRKKQRPEE